MLLIAGPGWAELQLGAWHGHPGRVSTGWKPVTQSNIAGEPASFPSENLPKKTQK